MRSQLGAREEGWVSEAGIRPEEAGRVSDPPLQMGEAGWISDPGVRPQQEGRVSDGRVTDPPLRIFRRLKKTAIVLMLLFRIDKPVGESEIAEILDLHPETTRIYLRSLAGLGLVTRTHRYRGWMLTAGGRQMILGEADHGWPILEAGKIRTTAEKPRSITESPTASAENPRSILESPVASAEIPRSRPIAAASLSFKAESNKQLQL